MYVCARVCGGVCVRAVARSRHRACVRAGAPRTTSRVTPLERLARVIRLCHPFDHVFTTLNRAVDTCRDNAHVVRLIPARRSDRNLCARH